MNIPVSDRDRRALTLGALIVIPIMAWFWGARPYLRAVEQSSERLAAERVLLVREEALLARAADFPLAWEQDSQRLMAVAPRLFGGDNPAVASAELAHYLQTGAERSRVLLTQIEPGTPEDVGNDLIAVSLRVEAESDLEGVLSLLHGLEGGTKLVRIEGLTVRSARAAAAVGPDDPQVLSFTFAATGFLFLGAGIAAPPPGTGEVVP